MGVRELHMNQARKVLSTYSSDTFGVISALYGLGGLLVMHDASGCNSTFTTHDEPRWYGDDGLVFVSAVTEEEAVMGTAGDRLAADMIEAAGHFKPNFTAIASTPIPWMTGSDIDLTAAEVEEKTGIPSFGFDVSGMRSYEIGASMALLALAKRFCSASEAPIAGSVNILGATPLDLEDEQYEHVKAVIEECGLNVLSSWSMKGRFEDLAKASSAEVSLVVSVTGIDTAKYLFEQFGIPYVIGLPCGPVTDSAVASALKNAVNEKKCISVFDGFVSDRDAVTVVIGEPVAARSLAMEKNAVLSNDDTGNISVKGNVRVISPIVDSPNIEALLSDGDIMTTSETEIEDELSKCKTIYADGLYRFVCPEDAELIKVHHRAYSGRIM